MSYTVRPVLHDKNALARSTPRNGPHGLTRNRYGTHLTLSGSGRAWNFLWHSRSPAAHHLRYVVWPSLTSGQATLDCDTLRSHSKFKQALVDCVRLLNARACAAGCCKNASFCDSKGYVAILNLQDFSFTCLLSLLMP